MESMRKQMLAIVLFCVVFCLTGCGAVPEKSPQSVQETSMPVNEYENVESKENRMIAMTIGNQKIQVILENNPTADALLDLLKNEKITISASNYGGFEKVCVLGRTLPSDDAYTTAVAGDVMLYQGNKIVLFYGSNSWDYTRIGRILDLTDLDQILGGEETEVTIVLDR